MNRIIFLFGCLSLITSLSGQGVVEKITDLLEIKLGQPPTDSTQYQPRIVLTPVLYYGPRTSIGFGGGGSLLFKPKGSGLETRTSNIPVRLSYTLNNQVFFSSSYTVFFPEEKYLLRGNLNYSDFPQGYFGVGNLQADAEEVDITFQNLLIEPLLLKRVAGDLFIGGGFRYNHFYKTLLLEDFGEKPAGASFQDELGSTSAGVELAVSYDGRDNVVNARKGFLLEFTQGLYEEILGGTHVFQLSKIDARYYTSISPKQVLAFNLFARYAGSDAPIQELSALGGETILRGYPDARFRDHLALFTQAEWRYQPFKTFGFVGYGGVGRVAEDFGYLQFDDLYLSIGAGLRVTVIPSERINLRIDYAHGFGPVNDRGFYLGLGEAF